MPGMPVSGCVYSGVIDIAGSIATGFPVPEPCGIWRQRQKFKTPVAGINAHLESARC